ncbi:diacylglycerol kinase beta [Histomonas meleagridis]|uniref:diacylglycerol kinase beta n=1 Tax=Histomonas meleagridis TaxID=135588 RepID=UPI00355A3850|nr:diacylglycerol kinase beta [Histomonas meleagridis]KAH0806746.1 diacylglycerol kinase beta [Histomonas meleagridis]
MMEKPLLIFINKGSGGGLGAELAKMVEGKSDIYPVILPDEQDTWTSKYSDVMNNPELRAIAAGGDGTVNWAITLLTKAYTQDFHPPLAVIPFGTGNDMSRSIGWGTGMNKKSLANIFEHLEKIRNSQIQKNVDIWEITIKKKDSEEVVSHQMLNYFSLGVDASIAADYESIRKEVKPKSQFESLFLYVPAAIKNSFGKKLLSEYLDVQLHDFNGHPEPIALKPSSIHKTLVFLSTKTIYGGKELWKGTAPCEMDDGFAEVILIGGFKSLTAITAGMNLSTPYGQVKGATITSKSDCFYQIDGEAMYIDAPATFEFKHKRTYPFLFGQ